MEASAADHYVHGKLGESLKIYNALLKSDTSNAVLLCNRAAVQLRLQMNRKALQDCDAAIASNSACLRAYILKGQVLQALNKPAEAIQAWSAGLAIGSGDVLLLAELYQCLNPGTTVTSGTPAVTPAVAVAPAPAAAPLDPKGPPPLEPAPRTAPVHSPARATMNQTQVAAMVQEGFMLVNSGKLVEAIDLFNLLLKQHPKLVALYMGRGTAYALSDDLLQAIADFSKALELDPDSAECWKRRGQSFAALKKEADAIKDLTRAVELAPDSDTFQQRGMVYHRMGNYRRAIPDFQRSVSLDVTNKAALNLAGLCQTAVGMCDSALMSFEKLRKLEPAFKEAWVNTAQAYRELGNAVQAEAHFARALQLDPRYVSALHLRALARHGSGDMRGALADLDRALELESKHLECRYLRAVVLHGLGQFTRAVMDYSQVIASNSQHRCWYQKEIALYQRSSLDRRLCELSMDADLDPYFREAWCKTHPPSQLSNYKNQPPITGAIKDIELKDRALEQAAAVIEAAGPIGALLHLRSPGYLSNKRQQRFCGLAALDIAQQVRAAWADPDLTVDGRNSSAQREPHKFGWRDVYDIAVRWRQLSEPNDPVYWVDLLSPEQFAEGFGSQTPLVTGQTHVVRYYPMFPRAFAMMKKLIDEQCQPSAEMSKQVHEAADCAALHAIMRRDFWVVTPCHSTRVPGKLMEGTRLTLVQHPPEGYDFTIRTPGTPPRLLEYDAEMAYLFGLLTTEMRKPDAERSLDTVSDLILSLTFYWYNLMPLSRGSAAVGYTTLLALFLAAGYEIDTMVPEDFMVDWEGILLPTPKDFIGALKPWMYPARVPSTRLDGLPNVVSTFPTLRSAIEALNVL